MKNSSYNIHERYFASRSILQNIFEKLKSDKMISVEKVRKKSTISLISIFSVQIMTVINHQGTFCNHREREGEAAALLFSISHTTIPLHT